jgi:hypothetical protein
MSKPKIRWVTSMLVLLATTMEARPQTEQSGPPASQLLVRQTRKSVKSRGSLATGTIPGALPRLCFQPGVGWQNIPPEPPAVPARAATNGSMGLEVSSSTSVADPKSVYARFSTAKQAQSAVCAGDSINKKALGAGVEKFAILNRPGTIRSAESTKPITPASRAVNSPSSFPTYFAREAESDARSDQDRVHAFHAYTSSIKLRRLIRNAPDFRTRIKLQQLQNNPATPLHKATTSAKTRGAARTARRGERPNRLSSRRLASHDRPRNNPRALLSGAYR